MEVRLLVKKIEVYPGNGINASVDLDTFFNGPKVIKDMIDQLDFQEKQEVLTYLQYVLELKDEMVKDEYCEMMHANKQKRVEFAERIFREICDKAGYDRKEIVGKARFAFISTRRAIVISELKELGFAQNEIADAIQRDRCTVIHYLNRGFYLDEEKERNRVRDLMRDNEKVMQIKSLMESI